MTQRFLRKIDANGKSYEIREVYKRYPDSIEENFLALKMHRGYDALIKNVQFYFLCNEISEAVYTDLPNEPANEPVNEPVKNLK